MLEGHALEDFQRGLLTTAGIREVAVLSTCNRTEAYLVADDLAVAAEEVRDRLTVLSPEAGSFLREWRDEAAVERLFRVASALESQVVGEPQILGQVREALELGERVGTLGPNLHALFRAAIRCAREARVAGGVALNNPSIAREAVRAAAQSVPSLANASILVVGAGEISRLVVQTLGDQGAGKLIICNRTRSVAEDFAQEAGASTCAFDDLPRALETVDIVFTATSSARPVLTLADMPPVRAQTLSIFDLAVPRDVEAAVGQLPYVHLADLETLVAPGMSQEREQAMQAVVKAHVKDFSVWHLTRRVAPVIANLRSHVEAVQQQELARVARKLQSLSHEERAAVEDMTSRLIDKMFHHLVTRLRLAAQADAKLVEAAEFFFLHGDHAPFRHALEDNPEPASNDIADLLPQEPSSHP